LTDTYKQVTIQYLDNGAKDIVWIPSYLSKRHQIVVHKESGRKYKVLSVRPNGISEEKTLAFPKSIFSSDS